MSPAMRNGCRRVVSFGIGLLTLPGCHQPDSAAPVVAVEATTSGDWFVEIAAASGLEFVHDRGATGRYYFPEIGGAGAALFDYDGDGDLDVYLVQGGALGPDRAAADRAGDRLFRNDLAAGVPRFVDVTAEAGIDARGYGVGAATADVDGDGDVDLYLTNFGRNQLLSNNGDGTFSDRTDESGTGESRWSSSACFLDFDRDGRLDLYVANYTNFGFDNHKDCRSRTGNHDYCGPQSYEPEPDRLYRNLGDGRFADVSASSGIVSHYGAGLGVVSADFDGDAWPDLFVANDQMANFLWMNRHDGTFDEQGLLSGTALGADGSMEASMGVDAGDIDNDGDEDLFMTHLRAQTNTVYVNEGTGWFSDASYKTGLGGPSLDFTGFGALLFDYDGDGWLDVLAVNGAVSALEALERIGDPFPYHQTNQLFHNAGAGVFEEVSAGAGIAFDLSEAGRGAAAGDLDNDGDTDVVISNLSGPVRLLENRIGAAGGFAGLRWLAGAGGEAIGTRATVLRRDGLRLTRHVRTAASYASANDPRLSFGLGGTGGPVTFDVTTPARSRTRWTDVPAGAYLVGRGD
ncbi:MAG: CRTAC1 family protein [Acidobacteriota bacterium]|nr:CRTAC1 family protein [Acidobacteriota bacterium]